MPTEQSLPRIVTLPEIEEVASSDEFAVRLIDAVGEGFVAYSRGRFNAPPIQTMGAPPMAPFGGGGGGAVGDYQAQACVKSGYVTGSSHYVVKVASGGRPFPSNSGLMQLYSQSTGRLETILMDEGMLTELRTAAAGALAARMLAPDLVGSRVGVMGTGVQARYQLRYLKHVTDCREALVWGRTEENVRNFIDDMAGEGWNVTSVDAPNELLDRCGLIVATTSSREPLLGKGRESDEARTKDDRALHITCIGSDAPGKVELDDGLIASADLLAADSRLQTRERGEFEGAISRGAVSVEDVVEIGELAVRGELHRKRGHGSEGEGDRRLTIFDSSGVAVQDCVIATMVNDAILQG